MNKKLKMVIWIVVAVVLVGVIGFTAYNFYLSRTEEVAHPQVTFEIENYGNVKMELYPEYAPNTVANIIKLVESGYYNGKVIYGKDEICLYAGRNTEGDIDATKISLIDSSVEADSEEDFEYAIPGEFVLNGNEKNTLSHEKGVVTLIRNDYTQYFSDLAEESYNSGSSQVGIIMNDARALNGVYAGFGRILEGMDVLEKIYNDSSTAAVEEGETAAIETFETAPVIKSAKVDTFGNNYGKPEVVEAFNYETYLSDMLSSYYTMEDTTEEHSHE